MLSKFLVLSTPLILFITIRLIILSLVDLYQIRYSLKSPLQWNQVPIQLLMGFAYLGYNYCFFGALTSLPLIACVAIYLSYPIFVPWILKAWIGKRLAKFFWAPSLLCLIGLLFSFSRKLSLNNILLIVALFSTFLKAFHQTSFLRLKISEPPLALWITQYGLSLIASGLLLITSPFNFHWRSLCLILIVIAFELAYKHMIKFCKKSFNLLIFSSLLNLSIFICALLDFLIFKTIPPFQLSLSALLLYFGIFFVFFQKNPLANSLHDL